MKRWFGAERWQWQWNRWSHIHMWWIKIGRDTLGVSDPSPRPDGTAPSSSARKINLHNFWLQKPVGVGEAGETAGFPGDSAERACTDLKRMKNPHPLGFITRATARRVLVEYREWVK